MGYNVGNPLGMEGVYIHYSQYFTKLDEEWNQNPFSLPTKERRDRISQEMCIVGKDSCSSSVTLDKSNFSESLLSHL